MENQILTETEGAAILTEGSGSSALLASTHIDSALPRTEYKSFKGRRKAMWVLLILVLAPVVLYYIWMRGFAYLNFSREVYTDYFWYRAPWLLVHIVFGLIATLTGPIQFIPVVRSKYPVLHRSVGKIYLVSILISTLASFYLVSTAQLGLVYNVGLLMLGIVWLGSAVMAYVSIRNKNVRMHKEWMIKTYVLTLAFVNFRFVEDTMALMNISTFIDRKVLMAWACWAIPFFFTEVVLQCRRMVHTDSSSFYKVL